MKTLAMLLLIFSLTGCVIVSKEAVEIEEPAKYLVNSKIYINGKLISSNRIMTLEDLSSGISQTTEDSKLQMNVVASEISNEKIEDGILLKYDIQYLSGKKTITSKPQIIAKAGAEATIEISAKDKIELKVIATRE